MKLLIIGIDGGDRRILDAMNMLFLKKTLEQAQSFAAEEDLWQRGWAKVLSGRSGAETGALYTKPDVSAQGCQATQRFRCSDYSAVDAAPLWKQLEKAGESVGFMNIPTTFPAPKVNGFFVSGAGGGLADAGIAREVYYPEPVGEMLLADNYIMDTRFMASGVHERGPFLERLKIMTERRVAAYLRLVEHYKPSVGFVAFMGPRCIQYLAMQEIEKIIAKKDEPSTWTEEQREIAEVYRHFDEQVAWLVNEISPDNIMLVSDHGQSPYQYQVDMGAFLKEHGWQVDRPQGRRSIQRRIKQFGKALLPQALAKKLAGNILAQRAVGSTSPVDFSRSVAFGMRYVPGIYINDERFNGPVKGVRARDELVEQLIAEFNQNPIAQEHGLIARPFDEHLSADRRVGVHVPDIWIDSPDTCFFEYGVGQQKEGPGQLISANPAYGKPLDWATVTRDQWTGTKGRHALLAASGPDVPEQIPNAVGDLRDAYKLIMRICGS